MPTSAEIMSQMQNYNSQAMTPEAALAEQNTSLGVDSAQQKVSGLRTAINNTTTLLKQVAPSVMGRTQNSLVTNAQATRQIANESAPIAENLSDQNRDYNTANEDYGMLSSKAERLANAKITGQNTQRSYLQSLYDSLYTSEENARRAAESKRQFDVEQANLNARAKAANAAASPSFDPGGGSRAGASVPQFAKGAVPSQAVVQLFQGYQPGTARGYTEQTVIPTLYRLMRLNNPTAYSDEFLKQSAMNLAYRYRKATFGE